jgi:DNA-binding transcriptional ArsR family regulator
MAGSDGRNHEARYNYLCPAGGAVATVLRHQDSAPLSVKIEAEGLDAIEWHHAQVSCVDLESSRCPHGGDRVEYAVPTPAGTLLVRQFSYEQLLSQGAELTGNGTALWATAGGAQLNVGIHGWMRLPLATTSEACSGCIGPQNQTLYAAGNLTLADLHPGSDGRLAATAMGVPVSARFDETVVDPAVLFAAGATGTVVVATASLILLARFLAGLFSRIHPDQALDSERRRRILEAIQAHPGIHFRELARETEISRGNVAHHLRVLASAGHVVERRQGRTRRFFENHGRYGDEWQAIALLRDPALRRLHDWVAAHPSVPQHVVVRQALGWGWSRSTVYHRLERLTKGGLLLENPADGSLASLHVPRPSAASQADGAVT